MFEQVWINFKCI